MSTPRVRVVLQSRMTSSRLPAKAMLTVAGMPMTVLAARRAANRGAEVVVATSTEREDDTIARAVGRHGIAVHRGPLDDPLARFAQATADLEPGDLVVRLTADNVFPDGELVQALVDGLLAHGAGYARIGGYELPYGISGEIFTRAALVEADTQATSAYDREHVTPHVRRHHDDLLLSLDDVPVGWRGLRCTVDAFDDYLAVEDVLAAEEDPVGVGWRDLCDRLLAHTDGEPLAWTTRSTGAVTQSPVILGTVQLGLDYGAANTEGLPSEQRAAGILRAAAQAGFSHVDTARAYGASEARIGSALRRGASERLEVVTKLAPLDDLPADADPGWCTAAVEASVARSLLALQSATVDVLLVHRWADWSRGGHAVRDALVRHRDAGTCTAVGASLSRPAELLEALADDACGYVQLPFNLLDHRWLTPEVHDALASRPDVVVTCRSVYLQGLLTVPDAAWPANVEADQASLHRDLESLRVALGRESLADLCLAYVLGHPWVTSAVIGADNEEQVRAAARLATRPALTADEIAHVRATLGEYPETLLDPSLWRHP